MRGRVRQKSGCAARDLASRLLLVALVSGCAASAAIAGQSASAASPPAQPEALTSLNGAFRQAYADARRRLLAGAGPRIIVSGDRIALVRNGQRVDAVFGVPLYDSLKTVAHIPLAIYVTLTPGDGAIDADRVKTLEGLRRLIPPARASLDGLGFAPPVVARQNQLVNESLAFIDEVLARRTFARDRLDALTRRLAPLLLENVADATRAQLDALHAQVSAWRREMSAGQWEQLHVVISGGHMPREGEVATQYFLRLLGEQAEGRRVVYAESLWEESGALDLLGTHLLDGSIGESFFGEAMRMHRDLLGDVARDYLPHLLPR